MGMYLTRLASIDPLREVDAMAFPQNSKLAPHNKEYRKFAPQARSFYG